MRNTPDDWDLHWEWCPRCKKMWHRSEIVCDCIECSRCGELFAPWSMYDDDVCKGCEAARREREEERVRFECADDHDTYEDGA